MKWPVNNPDGYATNLKEFAGSNLTLVNSSATDVYYDVVANGGALNSTAPGVVPIGTKIANGGGQVQFFDAPRDIWVRAATQTTLDVQADAYSAKSQTQKVVAGNALVIPTSKIKTPKKFLVGALVLLFLAQVANAQLTVQGNEQQIFYTGSTAYVRSNLAVNPNLLSSGINTFIMSVIPVTNSIRVYIVNDTANACANLTVSLASTGNANLTSFNQNVSAWQSVPTAINGTQFSASTPASLPASGTIAVTSQVIIGNKIALFVVLSSGCLTTNIDIQVVFGTFTPTVSAVQGVVPSGGNANPINPLLIGTKDSQTGIAVLAESIAQTGETTSSRGLSLGGANQGFGTTWIGSGIRAPAAVSDGPLAIVPVMPIGVNGGSPSTQPHAASMSHAVTGATGSSIDAMFVSDAGAFTTTASIIFTTTGQTAQLWNLQNVSNTLNGEFQTCHFDLIVSAVSGSAPTMDVFVQDGPDNSHWDDRIHFAQVTIPVRQAAGIAGTSANMTVHTTTSQTIAASTIVSGPIGPYGQIVVVVGGTTPSFTTQVVMNCK